MIVKTGFNKQKDNKMTKEKMTYLIVLSCLALIAKVKINKDFSIKRPLTDNVKTKSSKIKTVNVFLLGGQSNMMGIGSVAKLKTPYSETSQKVTAFKTPEMPFILARIREHYGKETGHNKFVRDAQVKVADQMKNVTCFDTDDCSMKNAGHYNANGYVVIGERFAKAYQNPDQPFSVNKKKEGN